MATRLISSGVLVFAALAGLVGARVDLGGGYMGLAMAGTTCSGAHQVACTELGDDWPDMGLACPLAHHDIPRHTLAMMSATIIQLGHYKPVPIEEFPSDECYTTQPNGTVASYGFISQGSFDMWFFAHDKCNCEAEQMPKCGISATEEEKCNLRTFTLCKVTKKTETCKPKHHLGWKPISESSGFQRIEEGGETEQKDHQAPKNAGGDNGEQEGKRNETVAGAERKVRFDPNHRQQPVFGDLSTFWWRIADLLGFWGAI
ncbi:hypothetical protein MJO28_008293 [Puccinia striiformis f. sp. tritici]|uniref:Secreted protein n=2 Tax=Puccinia striiformis TaxID=27350 RepID=A0A2S4V379_9BASI|nr:hypothetical protein Pst134EA_015628 [Puccinia striiformis f. sp. tritici]KAH9463539.1 hypothetical protein Pst134EA_015628 [Puccinia striiformis f. sp. tritici]KAI7949472.1 hypothetical protein MJO28_008293 [Puccinia striiformis f. sp. tritici]KAI9602647.1 hypothetical protein H4Q26_001939 [Puccinia striiformis f. sp. tritici PST-130]POW03974.1 hypothetical protein PSHT_11430 [Puccinia striiformis]